jgi:hypothetical protein
LDSHLRPRQLPRAAGLVFRPAGHRRRRHRRWRRGSWQAAATFVLLRFKLPGLVNI